MRIPTTGLQLALFLTALPLLSQQTATVLVRFHVVKDGAQVPGLTPDDFQLLEDGVPRDITFFSGGPPTPGGPPSTASRVGAPEPPVELIFLFDTTGQPWDHAHPVYGRD